MCFNLDDPLYDEKLLVAIKKQSYFPHLWINLKWKNFSANLRNYLCFQFLAEIIQTLDIYLVKIIISFLKTIHWPLACFKLIYCILILSYNFHIDKK